MYNKDDLDNAFGEGILLGLAMGVLLVIFWSMAG